MSVLAKLFFAFVMVGAFSFGGGYSALSVIQHQVVFQYGFVDTQTFMNIVAIAQVTPGPIALNAATFIGLKLGGIAGSLVATLGLLFVPGLLSVLAIIFLEIVRRKYPVDRFLVYLQKGIIILIGLAAATSIRSVVTSIPCIVLAAILFGVLQFARKIPIVVYVLGAGILGIVIRFFFPAG